MGYKNGSFGDFVNSVGHLIESRCVGHHLVADAGQLADKRWNRVARIEQRLKFVDDLAPVVANQGYFGKAGWAFYTPRRFNVDDTIHVKRRGRKQVTSRPIGLLKIHGKGQFNAAITFMVMTRYGLIGHPLTHSFSQTYFTEKFAREGITNARYDLFDMPDVQTALPNLFKLPGLRGLNVTIPHKTNVLPFLDRLDASAEKVGAVNVIRIEADGTRTGFNSDYYGFRQSLTNWVSGSIRQHSDEPGMLSILPANALILGTGGAAKAVVAALNDLGIEHKMVSRMSLPNGLTYADLPNVIADYQLVVNCSPVGTFPNTTAAPDLPYNQLTAQHWLYDLVYNPAETELMRRGKQQGAAVMNGYQMLVLQAEKAWEIWQE